MSAAPAYVSTRPDTAKFVSTQNGVTVTQTPSLISTQPTLDAVVRDAAKAGIALDLSPAASGVPKTGH